MIKFSLDLCRYRKLGMSKKNNSKQAGRQSAFQVLHFSCVFNKDGSEPCCGFGVPVETPTMLTHFQSLLQLERWEEKTHYPSCN